MKINKLKIILFVMFTGIFSLNFIPINIVHAETITTPPAPKYILLQPLPGLTNFDPNSDASGKTSALGTYINLMIHIFIGACAVMAVTMIVIGGIEYMTSELVSSKQAGKDRAINAVLGLLLALFAYALLYTINPDLLSLNLNVPVTTAKTAPLPTAPNITGTNPPK